MRHRSTATNLNNFVKFISEAIRGGCCLYRSTKACDFLSWCSSLQIKAYIGMTDKSLKIFISHLFSRTQVVLFNGYESQSVTSTSRVPKASNLGRFLFILFINDVHQYILLCANDIKIFKTVRSISDWISPGRIKWCFATGHWILYYAQLLGNARYYYIGLRAL